MPSPPLDPRRWLALAVTLTAGFMAMLDVFIVNVAIPSIQRDLRASFGDVELIMAAYQLAYGIFLITGGRLGDICGRKRCFVAGMAGFTLASWLAGLAPTTATLIAARAAQGLAAAVMFPQVMALIRVSFPDHERGLAFALFGLTAGLAAIVGQIGGGALITGNLLGLGWRSTFLVNVPIGLLALPAAVAAIHESRGIADRRFDLAGFGIVSLGLLLLIYPFVEGPGAEWTVWARGSFAVAIVTLAGFIAHQRGRTRRGKVPLVDLSLFRSRGFVVGLVMMAVLCMGIQSFTLLLSVYLQAGRGLTALAAGLVFTPTALGFSLASGISGSLARRLGRRALTLGTAIYVAGTVLTVFGVDRGVDAQTSYVFLLAMFLNGVGAGLLWAPLNNIVLTNIGGESVGSAAGVLTTVQQVAGAFGVAVLGMVFWATLGRYGAAELVPASGSGIPHAFATAALWRAGLLLALIPLGYLLPRLTVAVPGNGASGPVLPGWDTADVIDRFNQVFLRHDPAALSELIAEDCVIENIAPAPNGARTAGRDACIRLWEATATKPGTHFDLEEVFVAGDRAVIRWRYWWGNTQSIRGVNVMRVRDGLIIEGMGYVKGP